MCVLDVGVGRFAAGNWKREGVSLFGGAHCWAPSLCSSLLPSRSWLWSPSWLLSLFTAAAATLHFPSPSATLLRSRSAILGPPGYRRACGIPERSLAMPRPWANGSLTRRPFEHPASRVQADAALHPLSYEPTPLARSVASKWSSSTRQISERGAGIVPISRPRPLRSSVSASGQEDSSSDIALGRQRHIDEAAQK